MIVAPLLATVALACPATPVGYAAHRGESAPWITAGSGANRMDGFLYTLRPTLGDRRVREAGGLTLYAGALHKIAWLPRRWEGTGRMLRVVAERVDGPGRLTYRFPRALAPQFFPSGITLPSVGCWRLTLASGARRWTVHARAIEPPAEPPCDASGLGSGPNPVDGAFTTWIAVTPSRARIFATVSVSLPGVDDAAIYAGGRKVLWLVDRPDGLLRVTGRRLDGPPGEFHQAVRPAASPGYAYPSRLVLSEPGCWLLTVRTAGRGGVIVIRALAP